MGNLIDSIKGIQGADSGVHNSGTFKAHVDNNGVNQNKKKGLMPYEQVAFNQVFTFNPDSRTTNT